MRKNKINKVRLIKSLLAVTLLGFSALTFNAAAINQTGSSSSRQHMFIAEDTVKVVAGAPLKAEDVSPF